MLAIIYSDHYYIKVIPLLLPNIKYQCIAIAEVRTLKQFTCILMLCDPTPEVQILLSSYSGFKIAMGKIISIPGLYDYIYKHEYNDTENHYIPDLRLLRSNSSGRNLGHFSKCAIFENGSPPSSLHTLKAHLQKRYTVTTYNKTSFRSFEDLIKITRTVHCAICLTYQSFLACIVSGVPIYPIACKNRTKDFLEQLGLSSYNYCITSNISVPIITWYESLNDERNKILQCMDSFHKQSLFLFHKHPINRLLGIHMHDIRHIVFNLLHHTDDYLNGSRLLCAFILNDPMSTYVPIIYQKLSEGSGSLIDRIYLSTNNLLRERTLSPTIVQIHKIDTIEEFKYVKDQVPHLFTNNLKFDDNLHRTFIEWYTYMIYKGIIPYTNWWCGILHGNCEVLFEKIEFIQSLHRCRFIGVFCKSTAKSLRTHLKIFSPHTKVYIFNEK